MWRSTGSASDSFALLLQHHDRRADERLRHRGDGEDAVARHRRLLRRIDVAVRLVVHELAAPRDGDDRAAEAAALDLAFERRIEPRQTLGRHADAFRRRPRQRVLGAGGGCRERGKNGGGRNPQHGVTSLGPASTADATTFTPPAAARNTAGFRCAPAPPRAARPPPSAGGGRGRSRRRRGLAGRGSKGRRRPRSGARESSGASGARRRRAASRHGRRRFRRGFAARSAPSRTASSRHTAAHRHGLASAPRARRKRTSARFSPRAAAYHTGVARKSPSSASIGTAASMSAPAARSAAAVGCRRARRGPPRRASRRRRDAAPCGRADRSPSRAPAPRRGSPQRRRRPSASPPQTARSWSAALTAAATSASV